MPRKRTSENELVVPARAGAAPARRKPASTTRKKRIVASAEPSEILSASTMLESAETSEPAVAGVFTEPTHEEIARMAYAIWEARGGQGGSPEADWAEAKQQLLARN